MNLYNKEFINNHTTTFIKKSHTNKSHINQKSMK